MMSSRSVPRYGSANSASRRLERSTDSKMAETSAAVDEGLALMGSNLLA